MIKLKSVSKKFGLTVALHETDLWIETGETTALIGPSGCGKSTILRLIIGLLEPTTGSIEIDGQRVSPANILELRRPLAPLKSTASASHRQTSWSYGGVSDTSSRKAGCSRT
jgi:ABC-type Fe3+/spermidine/putrescine transport system ATPase subunit